MFRFLKKTSDQPEGGNPEGKASPLGAGKSGAEASAPLTPPPIPLPSTGKNAPSLKVTQPIAVPRIPSAPRAASPSAVGGASVPVGDAAPLGGVGSTLRGRLERLLLSLKPIIDQFSPEMRSLVAIEPSASTIVAIPVEWVMDQLASGRVEIAFGDLRRVAPASIFVRDSSKDDARIQIPLQEIMLRLDASYLTRRSQVKVELPSSIKKVFAKSGEEMPEAVSPPEGGLEIPPESTSGMGTGQSPFPPPVSLPVAQPGRPVVPAGPPSLSNLSRVGGSGRMTTPISVTPKKEAVAAPSEMAKVFADKPKVVEGQKMPTQEVPAAPTGLRLSAGSPAVTPKAAAPAPEPPVNLPPTTLKLSMEAPGAGVRPSPVPPVLPPANEPPSPLRLSIEPHAKAVPATPPVASVTPPVDLPPTAFKLAAHGAPPKVSTPPQAPASAPPNLPHSGFSLQKASGASVPPPVSSVPVPVPPKQPQPPLGAPPKLDAASLRKTVPLSSIGVNPPSRPLAPDVNGQPSDLAPRVAQAPQFPSQTPSLGKQSGAFKLDFGAPPSRPSAPTAAPQPPPLTARPQPSVPLAVQAQPARPVASPKAQTTGIPPTTQSPATPTTQAPTKLDISLVKISKAWPAEVTAEVASLAPETVVQFPLEDLAPMMKRGRVSSSWGQLRAWCLPRVTDESAQAGALLDVPLAEIVPLFIAVTRPAKTATRIVVDNDIPTPFARRNDEAVAAVAPDPHIPVSLPVEPPASPVSEEEPVAYAEPVVEEEPVAYAEPAVEEEPVAYAEPLVEEEPVAYAEPAVEEEPVAYAEPVVEEEPVAYAEPVVEEEPVAYAEPAVEEEPVAYAEPVVEEEPVAYAEPLVEEEPVPQMEPAIKPPAPVFARISPPEPPASREPTPAPVRPPRPAFPQAPAEVDEAPSVKPPALRISKREVVQAPAPTAPQTSFAAPRPPSPRPPAAEPREPQLPLPIRQPELAFRREEPPAPPSSIDALKSSQPIDLLGSVGAARIDKVQGLSATLGGMQNLNLPVEVLKRAIGLAGVDGALIALREGLLVGSKLPAGLKPETLAAFLPQVFSRVEQSTMPMQLGELQNLMFTAGDRPWQIWKAGPFFFAVLGRPNELLPNAQLKILAAQLARQSKA